MEKWKIFSNSTDDDTGETHSSDKIPVAEEHLRVGTRIVETASVKISKKVSSEEVTLNVPVSREEVVIEHKSINQYVDVLPPASRQEGETTILSVFKEVLVVEKKILLVEEVHISKKITETSVPVVDTIRKESIIIERSPTLLPGDKR